jgi:cytochrome c-550 PedF
MAQIRYMAANGCSMASNGDNIMGWPCVDRTPPPLAAITTTRSVRDFRGTMAVNVGAGSSGGVRMGPRRTHMAGGGLVVVLAAALVAGLAWGHGDVQPQPMNTAGLPPLGDKWLTENPYRGNARAIELGATGYTQNCARCHGIDGVSGGLAPDLRKLEITPDGDEWYIELTRKGFTQHGVNKMPAFEGILSQEAMWAIRTWLDTKTIDQ